MIGSIGFKVIKKRTQTNTLKWSIPFILNEGSDMFGFIKGFLEDRRLGEKLRNGLKKVAQVGTCPGLK